MMISGPDFETIFFKLWSLTNFKTVELLIATISSKKQPRFRIMKHQNIIWPKDKIE